jgi:hypothetical protein
VDRVGRGTLHIPALCLSVLGGIQPGKLRGYIEDTLSGSFGDDGLLQRFQVTVWPDVGGDWRNVDRWPDSRAREGAFAVFEQLATLDAEKLGITPERPGALPALRFCPEAQELFDAWRTELEHRLRSEELAPFPAFTAHLGKYRSLMPALALTFELVEGAAGGFVSFGSAVSARSAQLAAAWCEFLEAHARRIYGAELEPGLAAAQVLAKRIRAGDLEHDLTIRDLLRRQWAGLTRDEAVRAGLRELERAHWVRIERSTPGAEGGRSSERILLNPRLREGAL